MKLIFLPEKEEDISQLLMTVMTVIRDSTVDAQIENIHDILIAKDGLVIVSEKEKLFNKIKRELNRIGLEYRIQ